MHCIACKLHLRFHGEIFRVGQLAQENNEYFTSRNDPLHNIIMVIIIIVQAL